MAFSSQISLESLSIPVMQLFYFVLLFLTYCHSKEIDDVTEWLNTELNYGSGIGFQLLLKNIHPAGTSSGIVIASPSRIYTSTENDYFYHWTRDSALTMDLIVTLYKNGHRELENVIWEYGSLTRRMQENLGQNLGEPKFNVDGSLFTGRTLFYYYNSL